MSIEQTNEVDFIAIDANSGDLILTLSDHLDWDEVPTEHLLLLQEKLNAYLRFIESGEYLGSHPKAEGRPVLIDVVLKYRPNSEGEEFFKEVEKIVTGARIGFRHRVLVDESSPGSISISPAK